MQCIVGYLKKYSISSKQNRKAYFNFKIFLQKIVHSGKVRLSTTAIPNFKFPVIPKIVHESGESVHRLRPHTHTKCLKSRDVQFVLISKLISPVNQK